jgi:hypothetical protein
MAARVRGDATFAPSRHAAPQEKVDYTDPQVLMFNNLLLLGFNAVAMEKKQGVTFGPTMFSNTGATRQCDCVVHFLLSKIFPAEAAAAVEVALAIDGREAWRRRLGGTAGDEREPVAVDLDVAGARRLTLTIDFVPGDLGCGVRLTGGAFEK